MEQNDQLWLFLDWSKLGAGLYLSVLRSILCYLFLSSHSYLDTQSIIITGRSVAFPGHPLGSGLTPTAAKARILWWRLCIILKFELLLSWGSLENQTCIWVEQLFFPFMEIVSLWWDKFLLCGWLLLLMGWNFQELGLVPRIPVGTSLIDAHAGGVGVIESVPPSEAEGCHDLPCIYACKSIW